MTPPATGPGTDLEDDLRALAPFVGTGLGVDELAETLYRDWYLGLVPAAPRTGQLTPLDLDPVPVLVAAHAGSGRFDDGWLALAVSTAGRVQARRGDVTIVLEPGEYVGRTRRGRLPRPGEQIAVRAARGSVEGGCWVSRSARWDTSGVPLTRAYLDVAADDVPPLVAALTTALEAWGGGYAVKSFVDLVSVSRPDLVVLYVARDDWHEEVGALVTATTEASAHLMGNGSPRFTARLGPGLAVADGRPTGESHGAHRCRLVAEALLGLPSGATAADVAVAVRTALAAAGLDADRPYLDLGSTRDYARR